MKKFLSALKNDPSPVGDLAFDLLNDKSYPHVKYTRSYIKSHVLSQTSDPFVIQAMKDLFKLYRYRMRSEFLALRYSNYSVPTHRASFARERSAR
jgi:hypothetical protein